MTDIENTPTQSLREALPLHNTEILPHEAHPVKPDGALATDAGLTASLPACGHGDTTESMLLKQLGALDDLFTQTMDDYTDSTSHPTTYTQITRLTFALRLQNQCLRTAKALSAMDYMRGLQQHSLNADARPLPHDVSKRTRNDENGR